MHCPRSCLTREYFRSSTLLHPSSFYHLYAIICFIKLNHHKNASSSINCCFSRPWLVHRCIPSITKTSNSRSMLKSNHFREHSRYPPCEKTTRRKDEENFSHQTKWRVSDRGGDLIGRASLRVSKFRVYQSVWSALFLTDRRNFYFSRLFYFFRRKVSGSFISESVDENFFRHSVSRS